MSFREVEMECNSEQWDEILAPVLLEWACHSGHAHIIAKYVTGHGGSTVHHVPRELLALATVASIIRTNNLKRYQDAVELLQFVYSCTPQLKQNKECVDLLVNLKSKAISVDLFVDGSVRDPQRQTELLDKYFDPRLCSGTTIPPEDCTNVEEYSSALHASVRDGLDSLLETESAEGYLQFQPGGLFHMPTALHLRENLVASFNTVLRQARKCWPHPLLEEVLEECCEKTDSSKNDSLLDTYEPKNQVALRDFSVVVCNLPVYESSSDVSSNSSKQERLDRVLRERSLELLEAECLEEGEEKREVIAESERSLELLEAARLEEGEEKREVIAESESESESESELLEETPSSEDLQQDTASEEGEATVDSQTQESENVEVLSDFDRELLENARSPDIPRSMVTRSRRFRRVIPLESDTESDELPEVLSVKESPQLASTSSPSKRNGTAVLTRRSPPLTRSQHFRRVLFPENNPDSGEVSPDNSLPQVTRLQLSLSRGRKGRRNDKRKRAEAGVESSDEAGRRNDKRKRTEAGVESSDEAGRRNDKRKRAEAGVESSDEAGRRNDKRKRAEAGVESSDEAGRRNDKRKRAEAGMESSDEEAVPKKKVTFRSPSPSTDGDSELPVVEPEPVMKGPMTRSRRLRTENVLQFHSNQMEENAGGLEDQSTTESDGTVSEEYPIQTHIVTPAVREHALSVEEASSRTESPTTEQRVSKWSPAVARRQHVSPRPNLRQTTAVREHALSVEEASSRTESPTTEQRVSKWSPGVACRQHASLRPNLRQTTAVREHTLSVERAPSSRTKSPTTKQRVSKWSPAVARRQHASPRPNLRRATRKTADLPPPSPTRSSPGSKWSRRGQPSRREEQVVTDPLVVDVTDNSQQEVEASEQHQFQLRQRGKVGESSTRSPSTERRSQATRVRDGGKRAVDSSPGRDRDDWEGEEREEDCDFSSPPREIDLVDEELEATQAQSQYDYTAVQRLAHTGVSGPETESIVPESPQTRSPFKSPALYNLRRLRSHIQ